MSYRSGLIDSFGGREREWWADSQVSQRHNIKLPIIDDVKIEVLLTPRILQIFLGTRQRNLFFSTTPPRNMQDTHTTLGQCKRTTPRHMMKCRNCRLPRRFSGWLDSEMHDLIFQPWTGTSNHELHPRHPVKSQSHKAFPPRHTLQALPPNIQPISLRPSEFSFPLGCLGPRSDWSFLAFLDPRSPLASLPPKFPQV